MSDWTFYAARLVAPGELLGEVPLVGVTYTLGENAPADSNGKLDLGGDDQAINTELLRRIPEGQSVIYADYKGKIVSHAVVWKHDYQSADLAMQYVAADLLSYFAKRLCLFTRSYRNTEQVAIIQDILARTQGITAGNVGLAVQSELQAGATSPKRDRTIYLRDGLFVLPELTSMAETGAGFDMAVACTWRSSGNIVDRVLRVGYPRLGVDTSKGTKPRLALAYVRPSASGLDETGPGNVDSWSLSSDGGERANGVLAVSTTQDGRQLASYQRREVPPNTARLEARVAHDDVSVVATLRAHATAEVNRVSRNTADLTMTCTFGDDAYGEGTEPDQWDLYDDVLVRIHDPLRFPLDPDREFYAQIVGATVDVDASTVQFTLRPLRNRDGTRPDL